MHIPNLHDRHLNIHACWLKCKYQWNNTLTKCETMCIRQMEKRSSEGLWRIDCIASDSQTGWWGIRPTQRWLALRKSLVKLAQAVGTLSEIVQGFAFCLHNFAVPKIWQTLWFKNYRIILSFWHVFLLKCNINEFINFIHRTGRGGHTNLVFRNCSTTKFESY